MKRHPASLAYARALLDIGIANGQGDQIDGELTGLARLLREAPMLKAFFESPKIPRRDKKAVLDRALKSRVSATVLHFLHLLIDRGRQDLLGEIAAVHGERLDEVRGRVHVTIRAAAPLAGDSKARLVKLMAQKLGREIMVEEFVDERLLGGLTVRVGDTIIDGSVRSQLDKLKDRIASQRLGREWVHEN